MDANVRTLGETTDVAQSGRTVPVEVTAIGDHLTVGAQPGDNPFTAEDLQVLKAVLSTLETAGAFDMSDGSTADVVVDGVDTIVGVKPRDRLWSLEAHPDLSDDADHLGVAVYDDDDAVVLRPPDAD